jgi:hypothetical protein
MFLSSFGQGTAESWKCAFVLDGMLDTGSAVNIFVAGLLAPMDAMVLEHAQTQSVTYFGRGMDKDQVACNFKPLITPATKAGYSDMFRAKLATSKEGRPTCRFYDGDNAETCLDACTIAIRNGASVQAILEFTFVWIAANKSFGAQVVVKALQYVEVAEKEDELAGGAFPFAAESAADSLRFA